MFRRDTAKISLMSTLGNDEFVEIGSGVLIDVFTEYRVRLVMVEDPSDLTRFRVHDRA